MFDDEYLVRTWEGKRQGPHSILSISQCSLNTPPTFQGLYPSLCSQGCQSSVRSPGLQVRVLVSCDAEPTSAPSPILILYFGRENAEELEQRVMEGFL